MPQNSNTARLIRLILEMNPVQQLDLLKEVLGDGIEKHLLKLVLDLSPEEQRTVGDQARKMTLKEAAPLFPSAEKETPDVEGPEAPAPEGEADSPDSSGEEKLPSIGDREHPRADCEIPVGYAGDEGGAYGMARDISVGGMRMSTTTDLKVGQELQMNFPLPGGEITVRTSCRVIRVDRTGVAVAFVDLAPWIVEQIRRITTER